MGNGIQQEGHNTADTGEPPDGEQKNVGPTPAQPEGWHPDEKKHRCIERVYWFATIILTLIAAGGAIASTILAFQALKNSQSAAVSSQRASAEAKRQADAAENALLADQRAWVGPPEVNLVINRINSTISFVYKLKNFGRTPTTGLHFDGEFLPTAKTVSDWLDKVTSHCKDGKQIALQKTADWNLWSIVPNVDFVPLISGGPLDGGSIGEMARRPVLVGCITYGQSTGGLNQTGFYAPIYYRNSGIIDLPTVFAIHPN